MIKFYNTLSRKKETFRPLKGKEVRMYTCGPTVYNYAHIGNLRTYVFEDILQRTLEQNGFKIKRVMNVTDVGHLTSDADTGEDKIEKEAKAEKKTPAQIANFYTRAFLNDAKKLNIKLPAKLVPATKYIKEQQLLIKELFKNGYAYETPSAVYFNVSKFKKYGRLSRQSLKQKITAARKEVVKDQSKRNPADFVLWFKLVGKFKKHIQHWPSPWGKGFPGWHLECSAISRKFLGQPFDIHTGAVDHIGTHHENEIAQSEAAYKKPLARYWLHGEFLIIDEKRMGKSEKNFVTITDLEKKGFSPLAFRYLVLTTHYRSKLNFTWKSLESAKNALNKIYEFLKIPPDDRKPNDKKFETDYSGKFLEAMNNDLDAPRAIAIVWEIIKNKNTSSAAKKRLLDKFDAVFSLGFKNIRGIRVQIPQKITSLAAQREQFRVNKQFIKADALRKKIEGLGYTIEDTPDGPKVKAKI